MKKIILGLFLVVFKNTDAQTLILTKAAYEPVVGDTERVYAIDTTAYGSGLNISLTGSNTVWNYTNLTALPNSLISAYIDPAAVPNASNYAGCTVVQQQGSLYSFLKSVNSPSAQIEFMGISSPSLSMSFTNTAIAGKYPFTFGNSFTDNFSGSFTYSFSGTASGNATVTADGTGTLNLPGGIILNDVLRLKTSQSTNFSVFSVPAGSIKQITYGFYHSSQKFPVLSINYTTLSLAGQSPTITAQITGNTNNFTVGLKENISDNLMMKLYPNPAGDVLNIYVDQMTKPIEITIFDQLGRTVYYNEFEKQINLQNFNKGIYFIEIKTENGIARKKIIKN